MKSFLEYRDSGIDWIGKIPKHWQVLRNFAIFSDRSDRGYPHLPPFSVTQRAGVIPQEYSSDQIVRSSSRKENGKRICKGDLVYNKMRMWQGAVGVAPAEGRVSTAYVVCQPIRDLIPEFFEYLYRTPRYMAQSFRFSYGGCKDQYCLYPKDFKNIYTIFPPKPEQAQIVNFLDRKTEQINELIRIKERQIELLQEQRTVLIHQTVTKGLDPNVKMKPSGAEWIGEIPAHWTVTRLKYLGESIIGLSYKPENITDEKNGTLVLRASNIQNGKPSFLDNVYVNAEVNEKLYLKEGDILICSRSGSRELIGKNITITKELEGATFGVFMTVFRTKFFRFISHFLNSQVFKNQAGLFFTSTINQLTLDTFNNFLICFPRDEKEQTQIANYLDHKTAKIDELRSNEQRSLELLKEYRHTLISEVVTGKIDVRSEV